MMRLLFPIIFMCLSAQLFAQYGPETIWEQHFGGFKADEAVSAIEDMHNRIVIVGVTKSKAFRGEDVLIRIVDQNGKTLVKQNIGGRKDDRAYDVIEAADGGFIIGGYTGNQWAKSIGKNDAWLLKVDENANLLWDTIIGSESNDQVNALLATEMGAFVAAGNRGDTVFVAEFDPLGNQIWMSDVLNAANLVSLEYTETGYIVSGNTQQGGEARVYIAELNKLGEVLWVEFPEELQNIHAGDLTQRQNGNLLFVGTAETKKQRKDIYVAEMTDRAVFASGSYYGGYGNENAMGVLAVNDGTTFISGYTNSHTRGARRNNMWLTRLDQNLEQSWRKHAFYGGSGNDEGRNLTELRNGDILATGFSVSKGEVNQDAWAIRIKGSYVRPNLMLMATKMSEVTTWDENSNDTLDANERNFISLDITNLNQIDATNLKLRVVKRRAVPGLEVPDFVYLDRIKKGETITASIPVVANDEIHSGYNELNIQLLSPADSVVLETTHSFVSKERPRPQLEIIAHKFITNENIVDRQDTIELQLTIKNTGTAPAKTVGARFFVPYKIDAISPVYFYLDTLEAGEERTVSFKFMAWSIYQYHNITIQCSAIESTMRFGDFRPFQIKIRDFYDNPEMPIIIKKATKTPEELDLKKFGRGKSLPSGSLNLDMNFVWTAPSEFEPRGLEFPYLDQDLFFHIAITGTTKELTAENFEVYRNDSLAIDGRDCAVGAEALVGGAPTENSTMKYQYTNMIHLHEGENVIQIKVHVDGLEYSSAKLYITYTPPRNDLHVYAFGVPHDDLEFTTTDAEIFAREFDLQKGGLFENVKTRIFTDKDSTTSRYISDTFREIVKAQHGGKIDTNDAIIIFISSHGMTMENDSTQFLIAGSDMDILNPYRSFVNFQREILSALNEMNANIFLFIDACHSGAAANVDASAKSNENSIDAALSKAIVQLAESSPGVNMMLSCGPGELSWEDEAWGSGAFAKALVEAFGNSKYQKGKLRTRADQDNDGVLRMKELFEYVSYRVPELVTGKSNAKGIKQTPYASKKVIEDNLPVFKIINK